MLSSLIFTFFIKVPGFHKSRDNSPDEGYAFDPLEESDDDPEDILSIKRLSEPDESIATQKSRQTSVPRNYHFCNEEGCNKKYANVNHLKV
jgi:hypothetical protein